MIDLRSIPGVGFKPKDFNPLESIVAILWASFNEKPLEACVMEQLVLPSCWNTYWTDAAREDSRLHIHNIVVVPQWR